MTPSIKQEVGYITKYATPAEQERATATDNIQKTFGEDGTCKSRDMIADKQTDEVITILHFSYPGQSN